MKRISFIGHCGQAILLGLLFTFNPSIAAGKPEAADRENVAAKRTTSLPSRSLGLDVKVEISPAPPKDLFFARVQALGSARAASLLNTEFASALRSLGISSQANSAAAEGSALLDLKAEFYGSGFMKYTPGDYLDPSLKGSATLAGTTWKGECDTSVFSNFIAEMSGTDMVKKLAFDCFVDLVKLGLISGLRGAGFKPLLTSQLLDRFSTEALLKILTQYPSSDTDPGFSLLIDKLVGRYAQRGTLRDEQHLIIQGFSQSLTLGLTSDQRKRLTAAIGRFKVSEAQEILQSLADKDPDLSIRREAKRSLEADKYLKIEIGYVGFLRSDWPTIGDEQWKAALLATENATSRKIVIGGKTIVFDLVPENEKNDQKLTAAVAKKLAEYKVSGVVGHVSATAITASQIYEAAGLPFVSGSAISPSLTDQGFRNVFRVVGREDSQAAGLAQYLKSIKRARVAVVHDSTAYGERLADGVIKAVKDLNITVVSIDRTRVQTIDFSEILNNIKSLAPDAVFYGGGAITGGLILKQARGLGIDSIFAFGNRACTELIRESAGRAADWNLICARPSLPPAATSKKFSDSYRARFGEAPKFYAAYTYDAVNVLIAAMQKSGSTNPLQYRPFLSGISYQGVTGQIEFDDKGDRRDPEIAIFAMKNGKLRPTVTLSGAKSTVIEPQLPATEGTKATKEQASGAEAGGQKTLSGPAVRFDGLYRGISFSLNEEEGVSLFTPEVDTWKYLRLYPDGSLLQVTSDGQPSAIAKWLAKGPDDANYGKGKYVISKNRIQFTVGRLALTEYDGLLADGVINSEAYSHATEHRGQVFYKFIQLPLK